MHMTNTPRVSDGTSSRQVVFSRKLSEQDSPGPVLEELLESVGGLKGRVVSGDIVLIKPNFVAPFSKATTDLAFVDFFISKIREAGGVPVVGESSGYEFDSEKTFKILGVRAFLEERGVDMINFEQHDFKRIELGDGLASVRVAEVALKAKLIINLAVLKGHSITKVTGATKNVFAFLDKSSRRKLHCSRLHDAIAALAAKFEGALHFVDARNLLTRAVFGKIRPLNYCLAGTNPFILDHFGSRLLGVNPESMLHLKNVPEYDIKGNIPASLPRLMDMESPKERIHRTMYSAFYWLDEVKCRLFGGKSIIPHLHWNFGVHPAIGNVTTEDVICLAELCPVGAIDICKKRIIKEKCIAVRCLKCFQEGPSGSIKLKGLNSPKDGKEYK